MSCRAAASFFLLLASGLCVAAEPLASVMVSRSEDVRPISLDGRVEAETQAVIAAQTGGRLVERLVEAGDAVKKGQVLLRIDDRESRQLTEASAAQLQAAEAQLALAKQERDRAAALLERKLIGQSQFDQADTRYRAALASVNALQASRRLSQTQQSFTQITAPFDGLVADMQVNVGDLALPGKPLLTVYNPARFRVLAPLSLQLVERWQRSEPVAVELTDGSRLQPAATTLVPNTDPLVQQVTLRFELPTSTPALLPGSFVKVWLPISAPPRLLVPASAVLRRGELTAVYVLNGSHTPSLRQVRLGQRWGDDIEILAGLLDGERVALDPLAAARQRAGAQP